MQKFHRDNVGVHYMRTIAIVLAMSIGATAFAQAADQAPLTPGKPAGVQKAQMALFGDPIFLALGIAAVAGGIALAATSQDHARTSGAFGVTANTTSTSTSP